MPYINGLYYEPEVALANDYCPETGVDLRKINPHAHRKSLWRTEPPVGKEGDEARRRRKLFDEYLAGHPEHSVEPATPELRPAEHVTLAPEQQVKA